MNELLVDLISTLWFILILRETLVRRYRSSQVGKIRDGLAIIVNKLDARTNQM